MELKSFTLMVCVVLVVVLDGVHGGKVKAKVKSGSEIPEKSKVSENPYMRVAKSLAREALSMVAESVKRNPKLGFNFTLPASNEPDPSNNGTAAPNRGGGINPVIPVTLSLFSSGEPLRIIEAVEIFIKTIINNILWALFLISGSAFFICNLVNCSNMGATLGGYTGYGGSGYGGGSGYHTTSYGSPVVEDSYAGSNIDRNTQPVFQALEKGYQKYQ